jgi:hypothetical protein
MRHAALFSNANVATNGAVTTAVLSAARWWLGTVDFRTLLVIPKVDAFPQAPQIERNPAVG